ncbi:hypothetical protein JCM3765_005065 [Sporobolomyces pararoseus]
MPSLTSVVSLALLALSPLAAARPTGTRPEEIVKRSRATPNARPPLPDYKNIDASIMDRINAMAAAARASARVKARSLDSVVDVNQLFQRSVESESLIKRQDASNTSVTTSTPSCLDSSATDVEINAALYYGGAGAVVQLCPGAKLSLTNAIFFTAANQVLTTQGNPTDDSRALLTVTGADQSCAIFAACDACQNIAVRSIQIDGARDKLGWVAGGIALLEMGGNTKGQTVQDCHLYEPRGWSILHGIEGYANSCRGMVVKNNQIGPSGYAPNNGVQFKKRQSTDWSANVGPGEWADGISMACGASTVTGNTVTDCTDGGIVVFGALGSTISGNTVIARNRRPLGGINMVDWNPWSGSFEGTVVEGNTLIADTNMMKVGIAIGGMVWGSDNRTAARTFGGTVRNNVFQSGSSGYFGYAIGIAGHKNANVYGNDASAANFGGDFSQACFPIIPSSQAFVYDQWTTPGTQMQNNFQNYPLVFLICQQPGPIIGSGMIAQASGMMLSGQGPVNASISASASSVSSTISASSTVSSSAVVNSTSAAPTSTSSSVSSTTDSSSAVSSSAVSSSAAPSSASSSSSASAPPAQAVANSTSASASSTVASSSQVSSSVVSSSVVSSSVVSSSVVSSTSTSTSSSASPSATLNNLALKATTTASSQTTWTGQYSKGAIDGIIGGYVTGGSYYTTQEWASSGEKSGAWITLNWGSIQRFNKIVLWDRPNLADQVLAGVITFGDGTGVSFSALPNDASTGLTINLAKTVASRTIKVKITKVSSTTKNAGLAEVQVYLASASQIVNPAALNPTKLLAEVPVASSTSDSAAASSTASSTSTGIVWSVVKSASIVYAPGKDTASSTSSSAAAPVWTKVENVVNRQLNLKRSRMILQDGDEDEERLGRRDGSAQLIGYSKPTPRPALVNPFDSLEKFKRQR